MYDGLIKELRIYANDETDEIRFKAADAIEELQKIANKLLAKYQEEATSVIWEYSGNIDEDIDRLNEEVRTLIAQINGAPREPGPKEE